MASDSTARRPILALAPRLRGRVVGVLGILLLGLVALCVLVALALGLFQTLLLDRPLDGAPDVLERLRQRAESGSYLYQRFAGRGTYRGDDSGDRDVVVRLNADA